MFAEGLLNARTILNIFNANSYDLKFNPMKMRQ